MSMGGERRSLSAHQVTNADENLLRRERESCRPYRLRVVYLYPFRFSDSRFSDLLFIFDQSDDQRPFSLQVMFKSFWGSQEQQAQPNPQEIPTNSWYPPSVVSSPSSSRPGTPSSSSSSGFNLQRPADRPQSPSHVSPAEAAGIIVLLKDKSVDELRKLLSDKDAYHQFLLSVDQVKIQNNLRDELRKETLQLARENLEKEPRIMELRNQCRIIRTTELAAAQEKLNELERQKQETLKFYAPASLLHGLQEAMNKTEEESEALHRQLLDSEIDVGVFVQKYKKLRNTYHRRALTHLAAKTSVTG